MEQIAARMEKRVKEGLDARMEVAGPAANKGKKGAIGKVFKGSIYYTGHSEGCQNRRFRTRFSCSQPIESFGGDRCSHGGIAACCTQWQEGAA